MFLPPRRAGSASRLKPTAHIQLSQTTSCGHPISVILKFETNYKNIFDCRIGVSVACAYAGHLRRIFASRTAKSEHKNGSYPIPMFLSKICLGTRHWNFKFTTSRRLVKQKLALVWCMYLSARPQEKVCFLENHISAPIASNSLVTHPSVILLRTIRWLLFHNTIHCWHPGWKLQPSRMVFPGLIL